MLKKWLEVNQKRNILLVVLIVIMQALSVISPYLTSPQLNMVFAGNFGGFLLITVIRFILRQIYNPAFNLYDYLFVKQTQGLLHNLRDKIMHHYYNQPYEQVSIMENNLVNNLQLLADDYFKKLSNVINEIVYALMVGVGLLSFHWILLVYTLVITGLSAIIPKLFDKNTNQATNLITHKNNKLLRVLENWIVALGEVRRYHLKDHLQKAVGQVSQQLENSEINRQKQLTFSQLAQAAINVSGIVGVPLIAGILYFRGQVQFGAIITSSYLANGIFSSLEEAMRTIVVIKSTKSLREKVLTLTTKVKQVADSGKVSRVTIKDLAITFNHGETVNYPDFTVSQGEKVLLTGDSGTGKSTLLKLLLGQIKPTKGKIVFYDEKGQVIEPAFEQFGYLAQDLVLFPETIKENITMFKQELNKRVLLAASKAGISDKDKFVLTGAGQTRLNLDHLTLSGGQQQKIVLARNFVQGKDWMFIDEATSAIDQPTTTKILQELTSTTATVVLIAHNLTTKQRQLFDREISLKKE